MLVDKSQPWSIIPVLNGPVDNGPVAQLAEQATLNRLVGRSIRPGVIKELGGSAAQFCTNYEILLSGSVGR